jgi:hypothetical protein
MFSCVPAKMMIVDVESEGETIRCGGYLIDRFFVIPSLDYFNMPLNDSPIPCTKVHQCYENPDYVLWYDYNSPAAAGKLTSDQQAFAAGPIPPRWIDRPDYEPNLLRLPSVKIVVAEKTAGGGDTLIFDNYYKTEDSVIGEGWYFIYDAQIYVVTAAPIPGGRTLGFSPALPAKLTIEAGMQLDICPGNTPWLQGQYISFNVHFKWPIYNYQQQARTPDTGDLLYLESNGNITTNAKDRYGNTNLPYYTITGYSEKDSVLYAKVAQQLGSKIYIENMVNELNIDASKWLMSPNSTVSYITTVTGNLRLMPHNMTMRIGGKQAWQDTTQTAKAMNQVGDQRRLQYVVSEQTTTYAQKRYNQIAPCYLIRANSKLRVIDWWASHT